MGVGLIVAFENHTGTLVKALGIRGDKSHLRLPAGLWQNQNNQVAYGNENYWEMIKFYRMGSEGRADCYEKLYIQGLCCYQKWPQQTVSMLSNFSSLQVSEADIDDALNTLNIAKNYTDEDLLLAHINAMNSGLIILNGENQLRLFGNARVVLHYVLLKKRIESSDYSPDEKSQLWKEGFEESRRILAMPFACGCHLEFSDDIKPYFMRTEKEHLKLSIVNYGVDRNSWAALNLNDVPPISEG